MTEPKVPASVSVNWWFGEKLLDGETEFRAELAENYVVSIVRSRQGPLGGGLYQLVVEFLSQLTLSEIAKVVLEGVAFDLIKSGTKAFFIRPFLEAYKRFKDRQKEERLLDIEQFRIVFQDTTLTIESLPHTDLVLELESIFHAVAENLETIKRGSKGQLFEIFIPVFEDTSSERVCRFRTLLSVDETMDTRRISSADYFKLWGLQYYSEGSPWCVYDVQHKTVIGEGFYTEGQYWTAKMNKHTGSLSRQTAP